MTKMTKTQQAVALDAHRNGGRVHAAAVTVRAMRRNGHTIQADERNISRAGLIAAGIDMDAIHGEALEEHFRRTTPVGSLGKSSKIVPAPNPRILAKLDACNDLSNPATRPAEFAAEAEEAEPAPAPKYVGFASGDEPGAPLCVNPRRGKRIMWDGERYIHTNGEVRCYQTVMGEATPPTGQPAPAPTLADGVTALRNELLDLRDVVKTLRRYAVADAPNTCRRAEDLSLTVVQHLDRIAARAPQRATDYASGLPLRMHMPCRRITDVQVDHCLSCDEAGTWRALYVLPDGA
jgi:hypothetical protein